MHLNAVPDFFVFSSYLDLLWGKFSAQENDLQAGFVVFEVLEQLNRALNDGTGGKGFEEVLQSGVVEVLVVVLATELSDETGFMGLAEGEIECGVEGEDVYHIKICNLIL